jgi:hypothetical protein
MPGDQTDAFDDECSDDEFSDDEFNDDELAELAMRAEPVDPFAPDAVPFDRVGVAAGGLLPDWYMPAPSLRRTSARTVVFASIVLALLVIDVMGLCVTYGVPDPVWK